MLIALRMLLGGLALLSLWLAPALTARAQAPAWQTAVAAAQPNSLAVSSIAQYAATDASGNVYVGGNFTGSLTLGATTLVSAGDQDVFVAKWSPASASFVWAQRLGGTDLEGFGGIAVSGASVYVVGAFRSVTATFGSLSLANSPAGSLGIADEGFVAKLTDAGTFTWAQRLGGTDSDSALGVAASGSNVYVVGVFGSKPFTLGNGTLRLNTQEYNSFVTKLTDSGASSSFVWVQQTTRLNDASVGYPTGDVTLYGVAVQGTTLYAVGSFTGPIGFGTAATLTTATSNSEDVVLARLTDAGSGGSFTAAQKAGGSKFDAAFGLIARGSDIYLSGRFYSATASFGSTVLANAAAGGGSADAFVAKLTDTGGTLAFSWAQRMGSEFYDDAFQLALNGNSLYVTGSFGGTTATFGSITLTNAGAADAYVARLVDAGNTSSFAWAQRAGGAGYDYGSALVLSGQRLYLGGRVSPPATFGPVTLAAGAGYQVAFLASLTDPAILATATPAAVAASLYPNPAHGSTTVQLAAGTGALWLFNALGRAVRRYPAATGTEATLDLRGLPAGLYVLRAVGSAGVAATYRLQVE